MDIKSSQGLGLINIPDPTDHKKHFAIKLSLVNAELLDIFQAKNRNPYMIDYWCASAPNITPHPLLL